MIAIVYQIYNYSNVLDDVDKISSSWTILNYIIYGMYAMIAWVVWNVVLYLMNAEILSNKAYEQRRNKIKEVAVHEQENFKDDDEEE